MRSLLGRFHRPMSRGLVNNMLTMNNLGDGSTLNLDFTTGVLDPRLTFSRASTATFVNSSGYVEIAGANLVLQSGDLSQNGVGQWTTRTNLTLTGWTGFIDPFGGSTAVKIIPNTTNATHNVGTADISMSIGIPYTVSVYVKAAGYSIVGLVTTNSNARAHFNLATQTSAGYGVTNTRTITDVGDGWYRITMSFTVANGPLVSLLIYAMNTATDPVANSFAGVSASTDGVLAWGAQLNPGSTAQTYYPTTTSAYHAPRFDYSPTNIGEPRGLLIEGQGVNLTTYSEDFANAAWTKSGLAQTPASGISPDNSNTATLIAENAGGFIKHSLERSVTVTAGSVYTWSVFLKEASSNSRRYACVQVADGQATAARNTVVFDLQTGTVTANGVNNGTAGAPTDVAYSITPYRDGWYRVSVTMKYVSSPCYPTVILSDISTLYGGSNQPFYTATVPYKGLLVYGAQLEAGSGSSYIPTGASGVTRVSDHCTIPTASFIPGNPYPQTLFVECIPNTPSTAFLDIVRIFDRTAGGAFSYGTEIYYYNASTMTAQRKIGAATNTERNFATGLAYGTRHKFALSIDASSFFGSYDGVTGLGVTTAPAALSTVATHLGIGCSGEASPNVVMFGTIRQIKFYPTALSQSEINTLTTL